MQLNDNIVNVEIRQEEPTSSVHNNFHVVFHVQQPIMPYILKYVQQ